jgi:hypothetical protein
MKNKKEEDPVVTIRMKKKVIELIDKERGRINTPRSSWIVQAVVEKLEKLGYEIERE